VAYPYDFSKPNKILQRYSLLTLGYSLFSPDDFEDDEEDEDVPFGSPPIISSQFEDECEWDGVTCNSTTLLIDTVNWSDEDLTGTIPDEVGLLAPSLKRLDLAENQIVGTLPDGLYRLTKLEHLYLHQNQLSGNISESISNLNGLLSFYAGNNNLSGRFPKGLGSPTLGGDNVRPLRYISLHRNQLTGSIPADLNLRALFYLDLSSNRLTGTFPADWVESIDSMNRLRHLYLDNNLLTGELPSNLQSIGNGRLESLLINDNQFVGEVPGGYEIRNHLQQVEVQNNLFNRIDDDYCSMAVFVAGELVNFRADCEVCDCQYFCGSDQCY